MVVLEGMWWVAGPSPSLLKRGQLRVAISPQL